MNKKQQKEEIRKRRGATFVGLAPRYGKTKKEYIEARYKKHKNKQNEDWIEHLFDFARARLA